MAEFQLQSTLERAPEARLHSAPLYTNSVSLPEVESAVPHSPLETTNPIFDEIIDAAPDEQEKLKKAYLISVGLRGLEVLDVLTKLKIEGEMLYAEPGFSLSATLSRLREVNIPYSAYTKTLPKLHDKGLIVVHDKKAIEITRDGEVTAEIAKNSPELCPAPRKLKASPSTTLNIAEYIVNATGVELDIQKNGFIPEHSPWLHGDETTTVVRRFAQDLSRSEDAITRRVFEMRYGHGFLEAKEALKEDDQGAKKATIESVRLTRAGITYTLEMEQLLRKKEKVVAESAVEQALELHEACTRFAYELGDEERADKLQTLVNDDKLYDLKPKDLKKSLGYLVSMFADLRSEYVETFSGKRRQA